MSNNKSVSVVGLVSVFMSGTCDTTVGDIREWLRQVDDLGIPDNTTMENCNLKVTYRASTVEKIFCSDCSPQKEHSGFVVYGKKCEESTPTNSG